MIGQFILVYLIRGLSDPPHRTYKLGAERGPTSSF